MAVFLAAVALDAVVKGGGNLAVAGTVALMVLLGWAQRMATGLRPFAGALELSPGSVTVSREGSLPETLSNIRSGWVLPGVDHAQVEFVGDDAVVTAVVPDAEAGYAALSAVGIDPSRRAMRLLLGGRWDRVGFGVATGFFVLLQGTPVFLLFAMALRLDGLTALSLGIGLLALATVLGGSMLGPAEVTLGADGVGWRHGFSKGFMAWSDVSDIETWHDQGILLRHRRGGHVIIPHSLRDRERLSGFVQFLRRAWQRALAPRATVLEALDRRGRSLADWREALRALRAGVAYRREALSTDDLAATLVDPAASPERRLAAAMCLRDMGMPDAPTRIRVAADACASDELRVALQRAADGDLDEATVARATER
jgi:hypothetical protein